MEISTCDVHGKNCEQNADIEMEKFNRISQEIYKTKTLRGMVNGLVDSVGRLFPRTQNGNAGASNSFVWGTFAAILGMSATGDLRGALAGAIIPAGEGALWFCLGVAENASCTNKLNEALTKFADHNSTEPLVIPVPSVYAFGQLIQIYTQKSAQ